MLVINIVYLVWFVKSFYTTKPSTFKVGDTITFKGRTVKIKLKEDIAKYAEPVDAMFGSYSGKHRFSCIIVFMFSILHFRTSKMFYSRFYMFDMFKAQWTDATKFRQTLMKYQLVWLFAVDLLMIVISIFGLLMIFNGLSNQLIITMIESVVLSIYLIVLQIIEKRRIIQIFSYTETKPPKQDADMKKFKQGRKL